MRFLATSALIARMHLPRLARSKRAVFCALLAFLPALVAFFVAQFGRTTPVEIATNLGWILLVQICVPLVALIAASAVVAEEIEDRTITYLFTRPVPRATLLVGRLASTLAFLLVLFAASTALLVLMASRSSAGGDPVGTGVWQPLGQAVLAGIATYAALFAMLGTVFKYPMIVGLAYTFVIEGFLANLPGSNQQFTITYYLRSLAVASRDPAWMQVEAFEFARFGSVASAWSTLALVFAVSLAIGAWRITKREFELTS